ncbi:MAG TPA: SAM-dependent methyltransferase, partial [Acidiferrobacteraceae bacterium]|nr:SAM-dependent methyltransferase [Acidiferrobacteraceae bacterium]
MRPDDGFPTPDPSEQQRSEQLVHVLRETLRAHGGALPFSRFMELALYAPELGYYTAESPKFGPEGDFVTAPELSPLFGACVARFCAAVLAQCPAGEIVEVGPGSGALAVSILQALAAEGRLPLRYTLVETSPSLMRRQQALLAAACPMLRDRIGWRTTLPEQVQGVVVANELLDALPAERFRVQQGVAHLLGVELLNDRFGWTLLEPAPARAQELVAAHALPEGYTSEWPEPARVWVEQAAARLTQGALLLVDYGFPAHEYYHPDRGCGTLMCHYRHRTHPDPLIFPGLQDITVHLDFSALANAGFEHGLRVAGYTNQAAFLLACGLTEMLAALPEGRDLRR